VTGTLDTFGLDAGGRGDPAAPARLATALATALDTVGAGYRHGSAPTGVGVFSS
jgi:hypothetical protein